MSEVGNKEMAEVVVLLMQNGEVERNSTKSEGLVKARNRLGINKVVFNQTDTVVAC